MRRRTFLTSTTGTAAAVAVPGTAPRRTVGMSDVQRLQAEAERLYEFNDRNGGQESLEKAALAGCRNVLDMQRGSASERVQRQLFRLAAEYTDLAAASCTDAHELGRAQAHLNQAMTYALLARDPAAELNVWNSMASVAQQRGNYAEAVAAAKAAQVTAVARRDPFFASLAHVRLAMGHAHLGDRVAALRALGHAQDALTRSDPTKPRPRWIAFHGQAQLDASAALVHDLVGDPERAEAVSHRALSATSDQFRRNRASRTAHLALAQLHQGEAEHACVTASSVVTIMGDTPLPGRVRTILHDFHRDLSRLAPSAACTREWGDRMRTTLGGSMRQMG